MGIRGILVLVFCAVVSAQTLEDASNDLAKSIAGHLTANETARLTVRNLSSLSQPMVIKSQTVIERALRKRLRDSVPVQVTLTISENLQGCLLIAEIRHDNDRAVEMAVFHVDPPAPTVHAGIAIEKKLIWEQDAPMLDAAVINDQLVILDTTGITRYERQDGKWTRTQTFDIPTTVRDPRGRLQISGSTIVANVPGTKCSGTWDPQLALTCESGGMFTAGRNTIESPDWAPFYSEARSGDDFLLAETDGRTHVYDAARKPVTAFRDWGSDFVEAPAGCTGIIATGPGDRGSTDFLALYDVVNRAPVRLSDPTEFPGPVIALWPGIAITHNLSTQRYDAFSLTMDCSR